MSTEDRSPPGDDPPGAAGAAESGDDGIDPATDDRPRMVRFALAERSFLVDAATVLEVLVAEPCTRLPGSAPAIIGVTNVRGRIVAVVDPRPALHPHVVHEPPGRFLVIATPTGPVGLLVDRVDDVIAVEPEGAVGRSGAAVADRTPANGTTLVVATATIGTHLVPVIDPLAVIAAVTAAPADPATDTTGVPAR